MLAGTELWVPREAATVGSAATMASLDGAAEPAGPPPPLQPVTSPPAASAATAVIAARRRTAAGPHRGITRVTGKNFARSAVDVRYGTDIQKA